ncbi:DUF6153 family protein [Streptomyces sp. B8F3]|uniref:DUF6153 family protein n=1 Tax=Streptomyces sp. B8F3 TaxID=3153573 RepID=UPI00325D837B
MTGSIRTGPRSRPAGRSFVLLVLAVLAGVLGMHALGPGGAPAAERPRAMAPGHGAPAAQAPVTAQMPMPVSGTQEASAGHVPAGQAPAVFVPAAQTPAAHAPGKRTPVATPAGDACSHTDGGSGHLAHADRTCAAAGTASAYAPPALADALPGAPAAAPVPMAGPAAGVPDRAPPDLAELQLLRI